MVGNHNSFGGHSWTNPYGRKQSWDDCWCDADLHLYSCTSMISQRKGKPAPARSVPLEWSWDFLWHRGWGSKSPQHVWFLSLTISIVKQVSPRIKDRLAMIARHSQPSTTNQPSVFAVDQPLWTILKPHNYQSFLNEPSTINHQLTTNWLKHLFTNN